MTTVRPATPMDADAIGRIQVESWRVAYAGLLPEETIAYRSAGWQRDGEKKDVFQGASVVELRYRKQL